MGYHDFRKFQSSFKNSQTVNPSELLQRQALGKNAKVDHFPHTNELLAAIRGGRQRFEIREEKTEKQHIDGLDSDYTYEELISSAIYKVTTSYQLYDTNYFNLDEEEILRTVTDISKNHIVHCPSTRKVEEGDFFIGTSAGSWMHRSSSNVAWKRFATNPVGLNIIRVVEQAVPADNGCFRVNTRDAHAIELFDTFDIQAHIKRPYSMMFFDGENLERTMQAAESYFHSEGTFIYPDSPFLACTDQTFSQNQAWYNALFPKSLNQQTYQYTLGSTVGCASLQYTVPGSFNFNYNANTVTHRSFLSKYFIAIFHSCLPL